MNTNQQRANNIAQAASAAVAGAAAAPTTEATTDNGFRPEFVEDECVTGFSALSLTEQILAGTAVGLAAGAAGYGAVKGTAALIGTEVVAAEGAMAAGFLGTSVAAMAPIAVGVVAVVGTAYAGKKIVDRVFENRTKVVRTRRVEPVEQPTQAPARSSAADWPLPAAPVAQAA